MVLQQSKMQLNVLRNYRFWFVWKWFLRLTPIVPFFSTWYRTFDRDWCILVWREVTTPIDSLLLRLTDLLMMWFFCNYVVILGSSGRVHLSHQFPQSRLQHKFLGSGICKHTDDRKVHWTHTHMHSLRSRRTHIRTGLTHYSLPIRRQYT